MPKPYINLRIGHIFGKGVQTVRELLGIKPVSSVETIEYGQSSCDGPLTAKLLNRDAYKGYVGVWHHPWECGETWCLLSADRYAQYLDMPFFVPNFRGHGPNPGEIIPEIATSFDAFIRRNKRGKIKFGIPFVDGYRKDCLAAKSKLREIYRKPKFIDFSHSNGAKTSFHTHEKNTDAKILFTMPRYLWDFDDLTDAIPHARKTKVPVLFADGFLDMATLPILNQWQIYNAVPDTTPKLGFTILSGPIASHITGWSDIYPDLAYWKQPIVDSYVVPFIKKEVFGQDSEEIYRALTTKKFGVVTLKHNLKFDCKN